MPRLAPRVKIHRDGTVTLSGIHHRDLRSLLTSASIGRYDGDKAMEKRHEESRKEAEEDKHGLREVILANIQDDLMWVRRQRAILDLIEKQLVPPFMDPYRFIPVSKLTQVERFVRKREVLSERAGRKKVEEIMTEWANRRATL